jgi:hypothetical protein
MIYENDLNKIIRFKHVIAHQKRPHETSPYYFDWFGNYTADNLAKHAIKMNKFE